MRTLSYLFTPSLRRSGRRFSHRYHYSISICKRQRLKQDLCKKPKIRFDFWQSKRPSRSGRAGKPWENLLLVRGFLFVILILVVIIVMVMIVVMLMFMLLMCLFCLFSKHFKLKISNIFHSSKDLLSIK